MLGGLSSFILVSTERLSKMRGECNKSSFCHPAAPFSVSFNVTAEPNKQGSEIGHCNTNLL